MLHVIAGLDPRIGGPPAAAVQSALALRERDVATDLAYVYDRRIDEGTEANVRTLADAGVGVHGFPVSRAAGGIAWRWGVSCRCAAWLVAHIRRYDVIHLHAAWTFTTLLGLVVAKLAGRRVVLTSHESLTGFDRAHSGFGARAVKRLVRMAYLRAFDIILMTSALEQCDSGDPQGRRSLVVPLAVELVRPTARVAHQTFRVGFLARLHPKKNLPLLMAAVARVDGDIELVVAGDGPPAYSEELRGLADELGLGERVTWLGFVDPSQRREFFAGIDVFAMPSAYECFGLAAAEALSAGVPVVLTPTVGVSGVVASHGSGVVCQPTADDLAAAISLLARDDALLERCSAAALRAADEEFSRRRHAERLLTAYSQPHATVATSKLPVTVVIPAKNEELNIREALRSVEWADEVFVVDSGSTDRTADIATSEGAEVVQFDFPGHGPRKKEWSLRNLPFKNEWVFLLDADERVTPELRAEIADAVDRGDHDGYCVNIEFFFMGRRMRCFQNIWVTRLFRHALGRFEDLGLNDLPMTGDNEIHEHVVIDGRLGFLQSTLLHEDRRDLVPWIDRHNRYSTWEAHLYRRFRHEPIGVGPLGFLRSTPPKRRRILRRLWVRLPFRSTLRFFIWYVLRRGFLDGREGFIFCVLMGWYEFTVSAKMRELERQGTIASWEPVRSEGAA